MEGAASGRRRRQQREARPAGGRAGRRPFQDPPPVVVKGNGQDAAQHEKLEMQTRRSLLKSGRTLPGGTGGRTVAACRRPLQAKHTPLRLSHCVRACAGRAWEPVRACGSQWESVGPPPLPITHLDDGRAGLHVAGAGGEIGSAVLRPAVHQRAAALGAGALAVLLCTQQSTQRSTQHRGDTVCNAEPAASPYGGGGNDALGAATAENDCLMVH